MTETFELITLGVGDAFSEYHYHTSFLLLAGGRRLQIDCPEPIRKILRESTHQAGRPTRLEEIDDFILTHLHADHASAFETICHHMKHFHEKKVRLHTSAEVLEVLWPQRLIATMGNAVNVRTGEPVHNRPEDYYEAHTLAANGESAIGPFHVSTRRTKHMIPTIGLIVRVGDLRLGYSCDTIFDPDHIEWLSGCDMIIHETNVGPHTDIRELAALPSEIRAKMWLVHYPDDLDVDSAPIQCLRQGSLHTITAAAR